MDTVVLGCDYLNWRGPASHRARLPSDFQTFYHYDHSIDFDNRPFARSIRYPSILTSNQITIKMPPKKSTTAAPKKAAAASVPAHGSYIGM